jgi:hypothetical protein
MDLGINSAFNVIQHSEFSLQLLQYPPVKLPDQRRTDAHDLHALGYAQELFRTMGGFSNFAISFSIISILTGAVTLYEPDLVMGGPAEMAVG